MLARKYPHEETFQRCHQWCPDEYQYHVIDRMEQCKDDRRIRRVSQYHIKQFFYGFICKRNQYHGSDIESEVA